MTSINISANDARPPGLNQYCDPIGRIYTGGNPLHNFNGGKKLSLEKYLRKKGLDKNCRKLGANGKPQKLNKYCDPIGRMYKGGTPLRSPTGKKLSLEKYLKKKGFDINCNKIAKNKRPKHLNKYCDPMGRMYKGGTPLHSPTGKSLSLEEYLSKKGLDKNCNKLKTQETEKQGTSSSM